MKISIWNDVIILKWDGKLPENMKPEAYHEPKDVLLFWPIITNHAKWAKKLGAFTMTFSKQNMKRIHAQFGAIDIESGADRVRELKARQEGLFNLAQKIKKIKELPVDQLPKYDYRLPPLAPYQHQGVVYLINNPLAALFADCGLGKTWMVLNSIEIHKKYNMIKGKTLIAVKLATIETGWLEDAEKFTSLKLGNLWVSSKKKNRREIITERMKQDYDAYIINHEGVRLFEEELIAMRFEKIIIDESTILKNFTGGRASTAFGLSIMNIAHVCKWKVIMSGTPAPNGPENLWGQFKFLDPAGLLLEPNYHDFQNQHMQVLDLRPKSQRHKPLSPRDPKKWIPTKETITDVGSLTSPFIFRVRMIDHLKDMPPLSIMKRVLDMGDEQLKHYNTMKEALRVVIDDERILATIKLTQLMKLRQITGGFIIDHNDVAHPLEENPKLDELDSLLNDEIAPEYKVVIYCQYQWEIKTLENRYKDHGVVTVYGGNNSDRNLNNIKAFREDPKVRLVILHPKSAAHGITFTMAHYMIFYSFDHSAEDNYQCIKRIERAGQKNAMFVYYIMMRKSIDEAIYQVIQKKNKDQRNLIDADKALLDAFMEE